MIRALLLGGIAVAVTAACLEKGDYPLAGNFVAASENRPGNAGPTISARYHGHWAPDAQACNNRGPTGYVIRIDGWGWRAFEDGVRVTRALSQRGEEHRYAVRSVGGPREVHSVLALRMSRAGQLEMTEWWGDENPRRRLLVRCPPILSDPLGSF